MPQIKPKVFFFDFDGVIVDSERQHMLATLEALKDRPDLLFEESYYFEKLLGFDDVGLFGSLWRKNNETLSAEELQKRRTLKNQALMKQLETASIFFDGVLDFIKIFATKKIPIAVVSGARRKEILACLQKGNLLDSFEFVISADDVKRSKPDPEPYETAYHNMLAKMPSLKPEDCWVIEDSPTGTASAKAAGLNVIGITNSVKREHLKQADFVITRYSEIEVCG